jgi:Cd(II)/Pb(II)-responsive transcriptional regulator
MEIDMKIGELANLTLCTVETIRYYEQQGLLSDPERTAGNYRDYQSSHITRLGLIRQCRSLDMSLEEIKVLLRFFDAPSENCGTVNTVLDEHIQHVSHRIQELQSLQNQLFTLRSKCNEESSAAECGILLNLAASDHVEKPAKAVGGLHVRTSH